MEEQAAWSIADLTEQELTDIEKAIHEGLILFGSVSI